MNYNLNATHGQSFMFFAEAKAATKVSCFIRLTVAAAAGYDHFDTCNDCFVIKDTKTNKDSLCTLLPQALPLTDWKEMAYKLTRGFATPLFCVWVCAASMSQNNLIASCVLACFCGIGCGVGCLT